MENYEVRVQKSKFHLSYGREASGSRLIRFFTTSRAAATRRLHASPQSSGRRSGIDSVSPASATRFLPH